MLQGLPDAAQMGAIADSWRPFRSAGSYYMWRVEAPRGSGKAKGGGGSKKGKVKAVGATPAPKTSSSEEDEGAASAGAGPSNRVPM